MLIVARDKVSLTRKSLLSQAQGCAMKIMGSRKGERYGYLSFFMSDSRKKYHSLVSACALFVSSQKGVGLLYGVD